MSSAAAENGVVILGSGLGGYTLARELRKLDADVAITIVTARKPSLLRVESMAGGSGYFTRFQVNTR